MGTLHVLSLEKRLSVSKAPPCSLEAFTMTFPQHTRPLHPEIGSLPVPWKSKPCRSLKADFECTTQRHAVPPAAPGRVSLNEKRYVQIPVAKRTKCFQSKIFSKFIFHFFKKTKIELLSSAQNERLCDFLHTRFGSHLRLVSAIWGDPPERYSVAPYLILPQVSSPT